jgi:hypothetical protein
VAAVVVRAAGDGIFTQRLKPRAASGRPRRTRRVTG